MRVIEHPVDVQFGDCDPAGIVFFPNFSRWMDAASLNYFVKCGIPPWNEYVKTTGIVGTPVLEIHTTFKKSATYGERIIVQSSVIEWNAKTFKHHHRVVRGDTLLCEGFETRVFVKRDAESGKIYAVSVPEEVLAKCRD